MAQYSYSDALVERIEAHHAERATQDASIGLEEVNSHDTNVQFNGVHVRKETMEFINELAPLGYKFAVSKECQYIYAGGGRYIFEEVEVYREGDEYTMGRIGFMNPARKHVHDVSKQVYTVYSRTIKSAKIRQFDWRHHVKSAKKLALAVKHAKTFLRIHSPLEVCNSSLISAAYNARGVSSTALQISSQLRREIFSNSANEAMKVLLSVTKGSIEPMSSILQSVLTKYEEAIVEYTAEVNRVRPAYHVNIFGTPDAQRAAIIEVPNINDQKYTYGDTESLRQDTPVTIVDVADIPEDIMGRIAVLSMNKDGHYISGLGFKVSSKSYWIEREGM